MSRGRCIGAGGRIRRGAGEPCTVGGCRPWDRHPALGNRSTSASLRQAVDCIPLPVSGYAPGSWIPERWKNPEATFVTVRTSLEVPGLLHGVLVSL